jgi:predicted transcriptional regulator
LIVLNQQIMNLQAEKIELAQLLLQTNNENLIKKVKALFKSEQKDWWNEASEEEKKAIEKGISQLDKGEGVAHEQVMKKYKKWL